MDFNEINQKKVDNYNQLEKDLSSSIPQDKSEPAGFQGEGVFFGEMPPKMHAEDYLKAALGWVYAAVSAISDAVSKVQWRLYRTNANGEIEEVLDHKAIDLLYKVNNFTTAFDHYWLSQEYLELTGEAPWFIDRGDSGKGEPEGIMLLRPDRLKIVQSKDTKAENPIDKYVYRQDYGKDFDIKPTELILLRYPDTLNPFRGKGTLEAAATTVDIDNFAESYNKRFFYNSARPDSVLTTEQKLSKQQKIELRNSINRLYRGNNNSHKTAILESGLDWKPMSLSQKDMDFLAQSQFSLTKILAIFRVPKALVGISDDVNLANAKIGEYVFSKWTIKPKLQRIAAQLNEFYLPMFTGTENLFLSFDDPVPTDVELNLKRYESALGKGYMTINEVRAEQNLEDVGPEGDVLLIPNTQRELGSPAPGSLFAGVAAPKVRKSFKNVIENSAGGYGRAKLNANVKQKVADDGKKKIQKIESRIDKLALELARTSYRKKAQEELKLKEEKILLRKEFVDLYLKSADNFEKNFDTGMKLVFENQKKKILSRVPQKAVNDDYLLDEEEEADIMVRIFTPLEKEIIRQQGNRAAMLAGQGRGAFDMSTAAVRAYLEKRVFRFSFEVNEETNKILSDSLAEGVKQGEGVPQLRKRVEETFDGMVKYRSERIARSEVIRASNFATTEAYEQSGVVDSVEWLSTEGNACEFCESMDGKTIPLGNTFFQKGDSFEGKDGGTLDLSYENINFPPLHPNCRCTVVPIIK